MAVGFQQVAPTVTAAANGATSVNVALGQRFNGVTLRVLNLNTVPVFVRAGIGAQTATAADTPVPPSTTGGGYTDIFVGPCDNVAFVLSAAGTSNVYICPGN